MRHAPVILSLAVALAAPLAASAPASGQTLEARRRALEALTGEEDALAQRLGAERNALAHLLGALEMFSRDPPPPLLVSPTDAKNAVRAMILAKALAPELQARARALAAETQRLEGVRRQAAQASGDLFAAESAIEDRQGRLSAVAADADLMAPPAARAAGQEAASLPAPVSLIAPTEGRIAARFGARLDNGLISHGFAWRASAGAQVVSPAAGVVAYAGPLNGWGNVVILRAGGGCHMVLSGLGKVTVAVGQSVAVGTPIGDMPSDGQSTSELYLEVRLATGPIDPAKLMGVARGAKINTAASR